MAFFSFLQLNTNNKGWSDLTSFLTCVLFYDWLGCQQDSQRSNKQRQSYAGLKHCPILSFGESMKIAATY